VLVGSWSCDWGIGRIQPKGRIFVGSHLLPPPLLSPESVLHSTKVARQAYSCGASLEIKGWSYFVRSTPAHADITLVRGLLSGKLSDKGSTSL
jgi:hypothetical protein